MAEAEKTVIESGGNKIPVFLGWSGPASEKVATVFREYLPAMIQALDPFMSKEDISKGSRWPSDIGDKLNDSRCGIFCVTPENLESKWIHFEAGAISKIVNESYVCPFLLGMSETELKAPLNMFQATTFDKNEVYKLLETLNSLCIGFGLEERTLRMSFETYWPKIESELSKIKKDITKPTVDKKTVKEASSADEHIEELVLNTRELLRQVSLLEKNAKMSFYPSNYVPQISPLAGSATTAVPSLDSSLRWNARAQREYIEGVIEKPLAKILSKEGNKLIACSLYDNGRKLYVLVYKPLTDSSLSWLDNECKRQELYYRIELWAETEE